MAPADDHEMVLPWASVMVTIVLLNDAFTCATPETMFFALAWASDGQQAKAEELVEWMDAHRTEVGAYPEKVGPDGKVVGD